MNILMLGGTGVMGGGGILGFLKHDHHVTITSRSKRISSDKNVQYVQIDARNLDALKKLLQVRYNAIIDFMVYSTAEFKERHELLLSNTDQYIFISSARVYAKSDAPITEDTPRLLDVSDDKEYLATDEYALCKARSEDVLEASGKKNYTIIRPSITYGENRLQLGVFEKEHWLYRALHGRSIVFSEDIASKYTTMTLGVDVAKGISALVGKKEALGEAFHITSEKAYLWRDILDCYARVLRDELGYDVNVVMTEKSHRLGRKEGRYQIIYCRYYNRSFDNSKVKPFVDVDGFTEPMEGLEQSLRAFLQKPSFQAMDWSLEAWSDRIAHEHTPLSEIPTWKKRISYLLRRYYLDFLIDVPKKILHG